jgi:hypothetical protein
MTDIQYQFNVSIGEPDEPEDYRVERRRPQAPFDEPFMGGHCIGMELSDGNMECELIYYLYDNIESCIAMIIAEGYYRFERPIERAKGMWTDVARRIRAKVESDRAYA